MIAPSMELATTAGFTSQVRESSGTIISVKPNAVRDWQTAARNVMPIAAATTSADNG